MPGDVQGRVAHGVPCVHIGAGRHERGDDGSTLVFGRLVQGGPSPEVPRVHIGTSRQQQAVAPVEVQGRSTPGVHQFRIRSGRQERLDDIFTTIPEERRGSRPVAGVDLRTGFQEPGDRTGTGGDVQQACTVVAAGVRVRPGFEQSRHDRSIPDRPPIVQRHLAPVVARVGVRARLEQEDHGGRVRPPSRMVQERGTTVVPGVDVVARGQAGIDLFGPGCRQKRWTAPVLAVGGIGHLAQVVSRQRVRTKLEQPLDHGWGQLPPAARPPRMQRRVARVVTRVHIRTRGHQRGDDLRFATGGNLVQRGPSLVVGGVHIRAGLDQDGNGGRIVSPIRRFVQRGPLVTVPGTHVRTGRQEGGDQRGGGARTRRVVQGGIRAS